MFTQMDAETGDYSTTCTWNENFDASTPCPLGCETETRSAEAVAVEAFIDWAGFNGFTLVRGAYGRTYALNSRGVAIAAGPVISA